MSVKKDSKRETDETATITPRDENTELPKILSIFLNDEGKLKRVTYVLRLTDTRTLSQIILEIRQLFAVGPKKGETVEEQQKYRWSLYDLNRTLIKKKTDLYFHPASTFQLQKRIAKSQQLNFSTESSKIAVQRRNSFLSEENTEGKEILKFPSVHQSGPTTPIGNIDFSRKSTSAKRRLLSNKTRMGWMLGKSTLRYQPTKKLRRRPLRQGMADKSEQTTFLELRGPVNENWVENKDQRKSTVKSKATAKKDSKPADGRENGPKMQGDVPSNGKPDTRTVEQDSSNRSRPTGYAAAIFGGPDLFTSSLDDRKNSIPLTSMYITMEKEKARNRNQPTKTVSYNLESSARQQKAKESAVVGLNDSLKANSSKSSGWSQGSSMMKTEKPSSKMIEKREVQ